MTFSIVRQDLFASASEVLVVGVNARGALGSGHLTVASALYPWQSDMFTGYARAGRIAPGGVLHAYTADELAAEKVRQAREDFGEPLLLFAATKYGPGQPPRLPYIMLALDAVRDLVRDFGASTCSVPALGCGEQYGLPRSERFTWHDDVLPYMCRLFARERCRYLLHSPLRFKEPTACRSTSSGAATAR